MVKFHTLLLGIVLVLCARPARGQDFTPIRSQVVPASADTIALDTLSIVPNSFMVSARFGSDSLVPILPSEFFLEPSTSRFALLKSVETDSLLCTYRVFPILFERTISHKDTSIFLPKNAINFEPYVFTPDYGGGGGTDFSEVDKSGSITRGLSFGNNQNLGVNSNLNLQLAGKLTQNLNILASITDDNIPIQPQGDTRQLQDFDQVFVQVYNDRFKLVAGDFQIKNRQENAFLKYFKRAQGATFTTTASGPLAKRKTTVQGSLALSKGKFARNQIQGVEGNQGPYRLRGAENEQFIIILAGTENVYIDGRLLQRGKAYDYTIDYNAAEVSFTPNQRITKDRRIVVEFQYSEKNYARSMLQAGVENTGERASYYLQAYAEQDAKNQSLQQDINTEGQTILETAGDNLLSALASSVDSLGYTADEVRYLERDSLGFSPVYVQSSDPDLAFYRVQFSLVGAGNGDYVESDFSAVGKVYKWVEPELVGGVLVRQGNYAPVILLVAPQKRQMVEAGGQVKVRKYSSLNFAGSVSNFDQNTFSARDKTDNVGWAGRLNYRIAKPLQADTTGWVLRSDLGGLFTGQNFTRVERFRTVEFERNWNILGTDFGNSFLAQPMASVGLQHGKQGSFGVQAEGLLADTLYEGYRGSLAANWQKNGYTIKADASILEAEGLSNSSFFRHKVDMAIPIFGVKLGFQDEQENNQFSAQNTDTLLATSYSFFDWQFYLQNGDSTKNKFKAYYRQRTDAGPRNTDLVRFARAEEYGAMVHFLKNTNHTFLANVSNRRLIIEDGSLTILEPENTLLSRLEHSFRTKKPWLVSTTFYEIGSGLEQRREFVYLQVQPGQGVYVWNDYNEDAVKDLNEFEIAQFAYEADYIRSFVPSNQYQKTFTNQFSQTLQLSPQRVWRGKEGVRKFLARWDNQTNYRIDRKTSQENDLDRFNPFLQEVADDVLVSQNSSLRNTLFFDRASSVFSFDFTHQNNRNKTLLTNGFESRSDRFNGLHSRWGLGKSFTGEISGKLGRKGTRSDFLTGRNYAIDHYSVAPKLTWQKGTTTRISLFAEQEEKENETVEGMGGEKAGILEIGLEAQWNQPGKGVVQLNFSVVKIDFAGTSNSSLAFELLNGLNPGQNYTWGGNIQRNLSKNLQLNLLYNGRISEGKSAIHSGGAQIRAFF